VANQVVTLMLVAKTEKGWRKMPVVSGRNGKIRPQLVNGEAFTSLNPTTHFDLSRDRKRSGPLGMHHVGLA
jgi:hypothetical protein